MYRWTVILMAGIALVLAACSGETVESNTASTSSGATATTAATAEPTADPTTTTPPETSTTDASPSADDIVFKTQFPIPSLAETAESGGPELTITMVWQP